MILGSGVLRRGNDMTHRMVSAFVVAGLLAGCSSRPREFTPVIASASGDPAAFDQAVAECQGLLASGKLNSEGRLASAGAGAAVGGATLAVGSAAASGAGLYGGMAIAGATIVALPFVALGGAYGLAKAKQKKKERAIQTAMMGCLAERGHQVTGWQRKGKVIPVKGPATAR
jgi:hypothetical protein